jgi:hypothetical protein
LARRHYVVHPLRDDITPHFRVNQSTGRFEPLTETGG